LVVHGGKWPTHGSSWGREVVSPKIFYDLKYQMRRCLMFANGESVDHAISEVLAQSYVLNQLAIMELQSYQILVLIGNALEIN
jgi:hypothetical protein